MAKIKVADAIFRFLERQGIANVYTVPGGGAMYLIDAITRFDNITGVSCHHEQAASIAAEYSARTSEGCNFGVCIVTSGPGATNALTGLVGAWLESIPVMFISGQAKSTDLIGDSGVRQIGVQEVDIISMVGSSSKYAKTWMPETDFPKELENAVNLMLTGRKGPIWIDLPLDVQSAMVEESIFDELSVDIPVYSCADNSFDEILSVIENAKRPLFYFGHGVRISEAEDLVIKLIEKTGVPFVSTWNAMDIFPYDYKGNMGRPGVVAERFSNFAVQNCDLLISIGSRLNNTLTAYNPEGFGKSAKKIIIDIDPNELKLNKMKNTIKICADAKVFIEDLLDKCAFSSLEVDWIDLLERWKLDFSLQKEEKAKKSDYIGHYDAVLSLSKSIPEDRIIVTGSSGLAVEAFYVAFKNKANQRILHTSGLGSMGYAVPAAIGVSFEKRTSENALYCVEGDGSLHMNIQDIGTLKSSGQKVCLIILNNKGYASIRATQKGYFEGRYFGTGPEGGNSFVEMSKLAKLFDYRYLPATSTKEIAAAIQEFEINDSCVLLDIKIQKNESLYPKSSVYFTEDGKMHSMPLEDMTPLLALDTLKKEMTFELNQASYKARED